jgi:hypothetical protein
MIGYRPSSVFAGFACCVLALTSAAQDPGLGASPPPRIQGPSGGPLAVPAGPGDATAGAAPLKFRMYALLGQTKAGAASGLDAELKPVEGVLKALPYTEYQKISIDERETPEGTETQFPINPVYSLVVQPGGSDDQGAAKLEIHVDLMQDGKLIKALTAQAAAKAGDALLLRGMPLPPGELVIVLQRDAGDQKSQDGQSDQEQQKQDQQDQQQSDQNSESKEDDSEKQQDEKKAYEKRQDEKEAKQDEKKDEQDQASPEDAEQDQTEKKDSKNLESILQSLEDVDRKEQAEVRNKRDRIDFKGDWW